MFGSFSVQLITSAHAKIMPGRLNTGMLEHARDVTFCYTIGSSSDEVGHKSVSV